MKRLSILDVLVSIAVLVAIFATLAPAVGRLQRPLNDSQCQANMRRWAQAMLIYAEENDGRMATNRLLPQYGIPGNISKQINLSPLWFDNNGNQLIFMYGLTWVESLYPYLQKRSIKTGRDFNAWMKCPNAMNVTYPVNSYKSRISYAFNANLVEYWTSLVRNPHKVMMLREMDRKVGSMLRPSNQSQGPNGSVPRNPFLTYNDSDMSGVGATSPFIQPVLHNHGSNIAFADGHIRYFDIKYYPEDFDVATNFDSQTQQWWNYVSNADPSLNKTIAVTP